MYTRHRDNNPRAGLACEGWFEQESLLSEREKLRVLEANLRVCLMSTQPLLRTIYRWQVWWKRRM